MIVFLSSISFHSGSEFSDKCTQLTNSIVNFSDNETRRCFHDSRAGHRERAKYELNNSKIHIECALVVPVPFIHLTLNFADNILLPRLLRQPGQLHFVTELKFDIFSVYRSNTTPTSVFCMSECYWPNGKTAEEVFSMLFHAIQAHRQDVRYNSCHRLVLHADIAAGRTKIGTWFGFLPCL